LDGETTVETLILALRNLGPVRLAIMGAIMLGMIGFFIFLATRLTTPSMVLLYGDLNANDSSRITSQLSSQNVPFELLQGGSQIMVPSDRALKLRLSLASQGIPSGGSLGYELFDDQQTIGTTSFVQNINLLRALEGELARTIQTISSIRSARVHLVFPRRELFSREKHQASASITLRMGDGSLEKDQIAGIQHLVAAAVPGLVPARVSIISSNGKLLAGGFEEDSASFMAVKSQEQRRNFERRMSRTIESLLEKTVGFGKVRAEVKADMDFDRISTTDEKFDPDGQVIKSNQAIEETNQTRDTEGTQPVTVGTNLPDPNTGSGENASSSSAESRTEETVNFEVSKKIINHVREVGIINRLSVAVLIDGVRGIDDNEPTYQPRSEAEMELLATLVRGAIGFNADRGDTVEVINMEFADVVVEGIELELFFGLDKNDLLRMAEVLVLSIVAILVILLVVRPLVSRAFETIPSAAAAGERLLTDQAGALTAPGMPSEVMVGEERFEELIDIDRVEGRVKASSVKQVGGLVEKHPEEALSILRSWMYEEG
jgi:flagellar M-ring protein FliF